jgi:hypothetical protein
MEWWQVPSESRMKCRVPKQKERAVPRELVLDSGMPALMLGSGRRGVEPVARRGPAAEQRPCPRQEELWAL